MPRFTRKQKGGTRISSTDKERLHETMRRIRKQESQIVHTLSQLYRFVQCFKTGDMSRTLQFAYNLGRLQELCFETVHPEVWWKPIEGFITETKWDELESYIQELKVSLGVEFDKDTLEKGC